MTSPQFEVAIIGGGTAGSAAALALQQRGVTSICIVEPSDFTPARVGETIPPDANLVLSQLGVDQVFARQGHLPCYGSHSLWGSPRLGHNDFLTSPYGVGWHLDRGRFDKMLLEQAVAGGARRITEHCASVAVQGDRITRVTAGGQQIRAGVFIDATGRRAVLLRALGGRQDFDDRQTVIWARFGVPAGAGFGNSTWLEAAPNGWWYAAEVPGGAAVVALGTDPKLAKAGGVYKIHSWAAALSGTALIAPRLKQARLLPDSFWITASHSYRAARVVGENWLAVGDAACAFDPLSSAGIYKALVNGQEAARAICDGRRGGYAKRIHQDYETYLIKRAELYQAEQRWAERAFWAQRQGRGQRTAQGYRSVSPQEMSTLA